MRTSSPIALSERALASLSGSQIELPRYDRSSVTAGILHLGAGNFHRSHQCVFLHRLLQRGLGKDFGIVSAGLLDFDKPVAAALQMQDCLFTVTEMSSGESATSVVGSMIGYLPGFANPGLVMEALAAPSISIVTLTVTESGYFVDPSTGRLQAEHPDVAHDIAAFGREKPRTALGYLAQGLKERFLRKAGPITLLSCDNLQSNGDLLRSSLKEFVSLTAPELTSRIEELVSFPNCMVDRITPRSSEEHRAFLRQNLGLLDEAPVVCEPYIQWVVEDSFIAGRPPLEEAGVQFTHDVKPYELMKLRLLNAGHSALGYLGALLGYRYIHEIAQDRDCAEFCRSFMDLDSTPTLAPLPDVNFGHYKDCLQTRFANSSIKDQALRICSDGSGKIRSFILPIVRDCIAQQRPYQRAALIIAAWIRFLAGCDEQGQPLPIEDPLATILQEKAHAAPQDASSVLNLTEIFGDLSAHQSFHDEVSRALRLLLTRGAREAMKELLATR